MNLRIILIFTALVFLLVGGVFAIKPPSAVGSDANIILWLHPDSAVLNSSGTDATIGQDVATWKDISGNGFDFTNTFTSRRPVLTTHNSKRYLDFTPGDFFENTAIKDSINGLDEFSIFITIKSDQTNTDKGFMDSENPNGTDDKICLRYDLRGANTGRANCMKTGMNGNTAANQVETQANTQATSVQTLTLVWKDGERLLVYINGVLNDSSSATIAAPLAGVSKIILGKGPKDTGGGLGGGAGWDGLIGEVVFYNKKFNADTIQQVASQISSIQSIATGPWNSASTWDCDCIPLDTYDITINSGHTVTLAGNSGARNLTVNTGGSLSLSTNNYTLSISEHLNVLGSLSSNSGTVNFTGDQTSYITGNFSAFNISINKSSAVTRVQSGSLSIQNELDVNSGTFQPNNRTTLLSTSSRTARIAQVSGTISGSLTVQRYIDGMGGDIGYRHFSTPFSNSTIASFQYHPSTNPGGVYTYGFSGSNTESAGGYISTFSYVEATAASNSDFNMGWTAATSANNSIGYNNAMTFYSGGSNYGTYNITSTGTPNTGTQTISNLTYGGLNLNAGWHLIGNPYASSIDWLQVSTSGVDALAYVFEQTSGGYVATPLLPNANIISSYQGFFIHVNNSTNSIQFEENDKSAVNTSFVRSASTYNRLKISAHNKSTGKKAVVALDINAYASADFDPAFDAYRIENPHGFPDFHFPVGNEKLQVNTLKEQDLSKNIPLSVGADSKTTIEIWIEETPKINGCLFLIDNKTGTYHPISDSSHFTVSVDPQDISSPRFEIGILNSINEKKIKNATCYNSSNGSIELAFNNFTGHWSIKNQLNEFISGGFDANPLIENLAANYYTIEWNSPDCGTFTDYFFIQQPEQINPVFEIPNSLSVGDNLTPNNLSSGAKKYKWFINNEEKSDATFPTFEFEKQGIYEIRLEAIHEDCSESTSDHLVVGPPDKNPASVKSADTYAEKVWISNGVLNWEGINDIKTVEILNTLGQRINFTEIPVGESEMAVPTLSSGTYIFGLKNSSGEQVHSLKWIK